MDANIFLFICLFVDPCLHQSSMLWAEIVHVRVSGLS